MTLQKTILALLAAMLAVIGTTATVVHAEGPDATPDPAQVFTGQDLAKYNSLPADTRNRIKDEIVPTLLSEVSDGPLREVTDEVYDAEVRALIKFVVDTEKEAQNSLEQAIMLLASVGSKSWERGVEPRDNGTNVACYYTTSMGSSSLVVYVGHVSSCGAAMEAIHASVRLKGSGYDSGWIHRRSTHASSVSSYTSHGYESDTCWNGGGDGWATPYDDGPSPSPGGGDRQLRHCV